MEAAPAGAAPMILLVRTRCSRASCRRRVVGYFGGLPFFEKAAVILFVAFAWWPRSIRPGRSACEAWRRGLRLWLACSCRPSRDRVHSDRRLTSGGVSTSR